MPSPIPQTLPEGFAEELLARAPSTDEPVIEIARRLLRERGVDRSNEWVRKRIKVLPGYKEALEANRRYRLKHGRRFRPAPSPGSILHPACYLFYSREELQRKGYIVPAKGFDPQRNIARYGLAPESLGRSARPEGATPSSPSSLV